MSAVRGRSARVHGVPNFEANNRLKFTADEQRAIQTAERAFGHQPHPGIVVRPGPRRGLALAIAIALAYLLSLGLVAALLHSFRSPESPRESGAPITEAIEREPQSQTIPNSSTFAFQSRMSIDQSGPETEASDEPISFFPDENGRVIFVNDDPIRPHTMRARKMTSNIRACALAGAPGQITPVGASSSLPTQVIGEEQ